VKTLQLEGRTPRVTPPSDGEATIRLTRSVFDELVKIAEHAVHADRLSMPSKIEAERLPTGWKIVAHAVAWIGRKKGITVSAAGVRCPTIRSKKYQLKHLIS